MDKHAKVGVASACISFGQDNPHRHTRSTTPAVILGAVHFLWRLGVEPEDGYLFQFQGCFIPHSRSSPHTFDPRQSQVAQVRNVMIICASPRLVPSTSPNNSAMMERPSSSDICCGRGRGKWNSPGNRQFKRLVHEYLERYQEASSKAEKSRIVETVLEESQRMGWRFVKEENGKWHEIGKNEKRCKVAHAIRDHLSNSKKKSERLASKAAANKNKGEAKGTKKKPPTQDEEDDEGKKPAASAPDAIESMGNVPQPTGHMNLPAQVQQNVPFQGFLATPHHLTLPREPVLGQQPTQQLEHWPNDRQQQNQEVQPLAVPSHGHGSHVLSATLRQQQSQAQASGTSQGASATTADTQASTSRIATYQSTTMRLQVPFQARQATSNSNAGHTTFPLSMLQFHDVGEQDLSVHRLFSGQTGEEPEGGRQQLEGIAPEESKVAGEEAFLEPLHFPDEGPGDTRSAGGSTSDNNVQHPGIGSIAQAHQGATAQRLHQMMMMMSHHGAGNATPGFLSRQHSTTHMNRSGNFGGLAGPASMLLQPNSFQSLQQQQQAAASLLPPLAPGSNHSALHPFQQQAMMGIPQSLAGMHGITAQLQHPFLSQGAGVGPSSFAGLGALSGTSPHAEAGENFTGAASAGEDQPTSPDDIEPNQVFPL